MNQKVLLRPSQQWHCWSSGWSCCNYNSSNFIIFHIYNVCILVYFRIWCFRVHCWCFYVESVQLRYIPNWNGTCEYWILYRVTASCSSIFFWVYLRVKDWVLHRLHDNLLPTTKISVNTPSSRYCLLGTSASKFSPDWWWMMTSAGYVFCARWSNTLAFTRIIIKVRIQVSAVRYTFDLLC